MAAPKKALTGIQRIVNRLRAVSAEKEGKGIIEAVCSGDGVLSEVKYVLRLNNDPWDDMTGGLPIGRIVEIFGLESSGKTALCWMAAYKAHKGEVYKRTCVGDGHSYNYELLDPATYNINILYVDNEHSLDGDTIEVNGETFEVALIRTETVEGVFKAIDNAQAELKKYEDDCGRMQFLVAVVDTIAGTATKEELAQAWDKDDYSRRPKQLQEGFRNLAQVISRRNICVICTNQVGDQFGYQAPKFKSSDPDWRAFSPPGGKALKFWSTLRVFMWQKDTNYRLVPDVKGQINHQAGILIGFKTVKNRTLAPFRSGRLVILFDRAGKGGLRSDFSLLESLIYYKMAEEKMGGDDGERSIIFKFREHGIEPTTFPDLMKTLSEQAAETDPKKKKERYKDPRIPYRAVWPKFLAEHKADIDALWAVAVKQSRIISGIDGEVVEVETEAEEGESPAEDEEQAPRRRTGRRNPLEALSDKV
jgi:RecA/RadA recombinase